ncbi:MAG: xanthine dehydrogenase accessory factor [Actinomycetota bacterium]|nr:xanthine dehydrogenase accessory factor [Actinomycetota bacterium]
MSEITDVLHAIEALSTQGERMALATVVAVRGSTYRRPGARLLVPEHGTPIGNISGGCLEGDVADVARIVMDEGTARLASWDLTADDDAVWGMGLGCNGAIDVFIEPAAQAADVAAALRSALEQERSICVVTVIGSDATGIPTGARLVLAADADGSDGSLGAPGLDAAATEAATAALRAGRSEVRVLADGVRAFVEVLEPPVRLLICGAGHDAAPVVRAAAALGWNAVVADDRAAFLTPDRYPEASGFVLVDQPRDISTEPTADERTYAVVMTHNFLRDKGYVQGLLATPVRYIGMLGPAARTERILAELRDAGGELSDQDRARLHGPAGLDLGSEGPEEIAQSIVAEIIAERHGREGGPLRARHGPIHDRPDVEAR